MSADSELLQEVERLRAWKQEALPLFDGLQDLGRALDVPLGVLVTGPVAVEAANDLRAKVARVEVLRDRWARLAGEAMDPDTREWLTAASASLRAALRGDA